MNSKTSQDKTFKPNAIALTIGGSDSGGGAGIQADIKTFQQMGIHGTSAISMITVQNTVGVKRVEVLPPSLVVEQIRAVVEDLPPLAAKTGALGNASVIDAVAEQAANFEFPLVVDPVMVSKHGDSLIDDDAVEAYRRLLKHALIVTPNRFELERLTGIPLSDEDSVARAIHDLHAMGARYVLVKMGEENGMSQHIFGTGEENTGINVNRFDTKHTHGAGCVLSAAITGYLALGETNILDAVHEAIKQVLLAIYNAHPIGQGHSPVETRVLLYS